VARYVLLTYSYVECMSDLMYSKGEYSMNGVMIHLVVHTNNQISKKSLAKRKVNLQNNNRYLTCKEKVFSIIGETRLFKTLNGRAKNETAYDGWGFDLESRSFDFFWYTAPTTFGNIVARKLAKEIIKLEKQFADQGFTIEILIKFGDNYFS